MASCAATPDVSNTVSPAFCLNLPDNFMISPLHLLEFDSDLASAILATCTNVARAEKSGCKFWLVPNRAVVTREVIPRTAIHSCNALKTFTINVNVHITTGPNPKHLVAIATSILEAPVCGVA